MAGNKDDPANIDLEPTRPTGRPRVQTDSPQLVSRETVATAQIEANKARLQADRDASQETSPTAQPHREKLEKRHDGQRDYGDLKRTHDEVAQQQQTNLEKAQELLREQQRHLEQDKDIDRDR